MPAAVCFSYKSSLNKYHLNLVSCRTASVSYWASIFCGTDLNWKTVSGIGSISCRHEELPLEPFLSAATELRPSATCLRSINHGRKDHISLLVSLFELRTEYQKVSNDEITSRDVVRSTEGFCNQLQKKKGF
ncbi:hypothetical protein AVEN_213831-1 [Araneus ventricosus]|uniref:Uncharacterized protein n=1 Tax=Araneus ventricosus TaxID=182803 RepID=A0A4Y2JYL3_ARAVE|nr:hypothetical protein AVEN_213831-1 [Araneus ventricosus]